MVTITDYKTYQTEDGKEFNALLVQGGIEAVKSKETGRMYITARTATINCTFNKETCETLKGTQFPGSISKVEVEPYEYEIPGSGEIITLTHRYEFMGEDESIIKDNVVEKELVV